MKRYYGAEFGQGRAFAEGGRALAALHVFSTKRDRDQWAKGGPAWLTKPGYRESCTWRRARDWFGLEGLQGPSEREILEKKGFEFVWAASAGVVCCHIPTADGTRWAGTYDLHDQPAYAIPHVFTVLAHRVQGLDGWDVVEVTQEFLRRAENVLDHDELWRL